VLPWLRDFVRDVLAVVETPDPVVEFGALQVEPGQDADLRPLFAGRPYLGTDLRPGPGVDRVEDLRALTLEDGSVGTALCLETLEHCEDPFAAGRELARVVGEGGVCLVSTPLMLGIHGYPNDYWRFTPEGLRVVLSGFDEVWTAGLGDPEMPVSVLGVAAHGRRLGLSLDRLPTVAARHARYVAAEGTVRIGPLRLAPRELARVAAREGRRLAAARLRRATLRR
jgi:SAM-dependent methyltransferase